MAAAIRVVTVQRGIDPRDFALVGFGGAGPMHVSRLADEFGITTVVVPWAAGVASAVGLVRADLGAEHRQPFPADLATLDTVAFQAAVGALEQRARDEIGRWRRRNAPSRLHARGRAGARARGAAAGRGNSTTAVAALPRPSRSATSPRTGVAPAPEVAAHRALRVRVVRRDPRGRRRPCPTSSRATISPNRSTSRPAYFTEHRGFVPTPVFDWSGLAPGDSIVGAAIVQAPDTTVVGAARTGRHARPRPQSGAARMTADPITTDVEFVSARRAEIVAIAGALFAERGYAHTTVREIADAAGILSGSLYHHFDSKESMIEALLRDFLDRIGREYTDVASAGRDPVTTLRALVHVAFGALATDHAAVAVMLNEYNVLVQYPRFAFLATRSRRRSACGWTCWTRACARASSATTFRPTPLPLPARRDLGERPLVPAGRTAPTRRHRRRVPHRAPRRIGDETTDGTTTRTDPMNDDPMSDGPSYFVLDEIEWPDERERADRAARARRGSRTARRAPEVPPARRGRLPFAVLGVPARLRGAAAQPRPRRAHPPARRELHHVRRPGARPPRSVVFRERRGVRLHGRRRRHGVRDRPRRPIEHHPRLTRSSLRVRRARWSRPSSPRGGGGWRRRGGRTSSDERSASSRSRSAAYARWRRRRCACPRR